jgi:hypothetical protein
VLELRQDSPLEPETALELRVREAGTDQFECHTLREVRSLTLSEVDDPHSALRKPADNPKRADMLENWIRGSVVTKQADGASFVGGEQLADFRSQGGILCAPGIEKALAVRLR